MNAGVENGSGETGNKSRRLSKAFSRSSRARSSRSSGSENAYEQAMMESANGVAPKRGMVLPFTPLSIAFHHINYFIDMPAVRNILFYFFALLPLFCNNF